MDFLSNPFVHWAVLQVPWWVWAVIFGGPALLAAFVWKPQWVAPIAAAIGAVTFANYLQQRGYNARVKKEMQDAQRSIDRAHEARRRADADNAHPDRLRDDDGHKRRL